MYVASNPQICNGAYLRSHIKIVTKKPKTLILPEAEIHKRLHHKAIQIVIFCSIIITFQN